ncbi:ATP-binding protein [Campylobacter jejuni]|nr:ATP-binding protein [Campylobacter jejuni]
MDKSRSKKIGGSGLGLSIVKSVLKLHKASIELKSELGKGCEFKMRFM